MGLRGNTNKNEKTNPQYFSFRYRLIQYWDNDEGRNLPVKHFPCDDDTFQAVAASLFLFEAHADAVAPLWLLLSHEKNF